MSSIRSSLKYLVCIFIVSSFSWDLSAQNGLNFDGIDDNIQTNFGGVIGTGNRTIEAWIRPIYVATQIVIADYGSMTLGQRFTFNLIDGKLRCEIGGQGVTGTTDLTDGFWHHVAVTYDNTAIEKFKLYVDGQLEAGFNLNSVVMNTSSITDFRLGRRVDNINHFVGDMDEVRFWNVARSAAEIASSMNTEFCNTHPNLVAYYKLNEGQPNASNTGLNSTYDASGNGNNGILNGFTLSGFTSNWSNGAGLNTTILTNNLAVTGCDGSYTSPSGAYTWTQSGTYYDTLLNVAGCDSILTISLDFSTSSSASFATSACNNYVSPSGQYTYTQSGIYQDTIQNAAGCDSIITIDLSILQTSAVLNVSACDSFTIPSGNATYNLSGTYMDTMMNTAGCDSIITINLTMAYSRESSESVTACFAYTSPNGTSYTTSGLYQDLYTTSEGCDSVVNLQVTIDTVNTSITRTGRTLTAQAINATYQWINCNNSSLIEGQTGRSYTASNNGSFAVIVTQGNCSDTSACETIDITGIEQDQKEDLRIFPNPSTGNIAIQAPFEAFIHKIQITNTVGMLLLEQEVNQQRYYEFSTTLPAGTYVLQILCDRGFYSSTLVIID